MSVETNREAIGTTDEGEVTIITFQDNVEDRSGEQSVVTTELVYRVVQGGHTVLDTLNKTQAQTVANALCGIVPAPTSRGAATATSGATSSA